MTNVVSFPTREFVVLTECVDKATGQDVYVLEYVEGGSRTVVGTYGTRREAVEATAAWDDDDHGGAA